MVKSFRTFLLHAFIINLVKGLPDKKIEKINLGKYINSEYSEYVPVIAPPDFVIATPNFIIPVWIPSIGLKKICVSVCVILLAAVFVILISFEGEVSFLLLLLFLQYPTLYLRLNLSPIF